MKLQDCLAELELLVNDLLESLSLIAEVEDRDVKYACHDFADALSYSFDRIISTCEKGAL